MVTANHNAIEHAFDSVLQKFVQQSEQLLPEIGKIKQVHLLRSFERPFSVQKVYRIEGQKGSTGIYVKIFKNTYQKSLDAFKKNVRQEYETLQFWYQRLNSHPNFTTFHPLFFDSEHHCIITEAIEGENLGKLVEQKARFYPSPEDARQLEQWLEQAGQLLATFQKLIQPEKTYSLETLLHDARIRLDEMVNNPNSKISVQLREKILSFYQHHMDEAKNLSRNDPPVYLHRDFGMNNILVAGHKLVIYDFNRMEVGHPLHDFTRLYFQLHMLGYKPIYRKAFLQKLKTAYFRGYGFQGSSQNLLFRFFLLRHVLTHYIGRMRRPEQSFLPRLYDQWVLFRHRQLMQRIIEGVPLE